MQSATASNRLAMMAGIPIGPISDIFIERFREERRKHASCAYCGCNGARDSIGRCRCCGAPGSVAVIAGGSIDDVRAARGINPVPLPQYPAVQQVWM